MERDSATFRDKGTEVPSLSWDKGTMGQAKNLAKGQDGPGRDSQNSGRDRPGQAGTGRDRPGQAGTGRDRPGQAGTGRDRPGQPKSGTGCGTKFYF
jgi:hypothetical protein